MLGGHRRRQDPVSSSEALPMDGDRLRQEQCSLPVGENLSLGPAGQVNILWESGCSDTMLFWPGPLSSSENARQDTLANTSGEAVRAWRSCV